MQKEHLEILLEDIREKFDLVLEGHASLDKKIGIKFDQLNEKIEINSLKIDALHQMVKQNSKKIDTLGIKIDGVTADLKAHRKDTEAHPGILKVNKG